MDKAQMVSFQGFFVSTFFFLLRNAASSAANICEPRTLPCDGYASSYWIKFPFQLNTTSSKQAKRCGYPGFNLSCNNQRQTILTLPHSEDFAVDLIDYFNQSIYIKDPDGCLPRRFLNQSFNLSGSPFQLLYQYGSYNFYNCSNVTADEYGIYGPVYCLSGHNFTVFTRLPSTAAAAGQCRFIMNAPFSFAQLGWSEPSCYCEPLVEECALKSDLSLEVGCFSTTTPSPSFGLSRSAKYGIAFGVGIPGTLCAIYLMWSKQCNQVQPNTQLSTSIVPQQTTLVMGLDEPTIESYPLTLLGESLRLPKPTEDTCSICLSKYQPNETLRTIPECCHYFHANCIDEWLKINVTCPICRNSPD